MKLTKILVPAFVICAMLTGCASSGGSSPVTAEAKKVAAATTTTTAAATSAPETTTTAAQTSAETTTVSEEVISEPDDLGFETGLDVPVITVPATYKGDFEYGGTTFKTVADVFAVETERPILASMGNVFICGFEKNGEAYRFLANMPDDIAEQLYAIDIFDEDHDKKVKELVKDLEIAQVEDLMADLPKQEELDKYIGMTGKDMLGAGFVYAGHSITEDSTVFFLETGFYSYNVTFEEDLSKEVEKEDFDGEKALEKLTVKAIEYDGLSGAITDIPVEQ